MNNEYLRNAGINVDEVLNFWGDMEAYSDNLIEFLNGIDKKLDELESYNDITNIKPGDKVIIPKTYEQ